MSQSDSDHHIPGNAPRHLILTAGDANVGDFIADHWLRSILASCDLADTDIAVLDYDLSAGQRARLDAAGVLRVPCHKDGHPANIRFRDAARFLATRDYGNVLMTDGGDLIVQSDVTSILRRPRNQMAAYRSPVVSFALKYWAGGEEAAPHLRELQQRFSHEPMLNVGVLLGPGPSFSALWECLVPHLGSMGRFGTEQPLISEYLLDNGYEPLDARYNCIPTLQPFGIRVSQGRIFDDHGLIPVVHNAGGISLGRAFARFGFGPFRNIKKPVVFALAKRYHLRHTEPPPRTGTD